MKISYVGGPKDHQEYVADALPTSITYPGKGKYVLTQKDGKHVLEWRSRV